MFAASQKMNVAAFQVSAFVKSRKTSVYQKEQVMLFAVISAATLNKFVAVMGRFFQVLAHGNLIKHALLEEKNAAEL